MKKCHSPQPKSKNQRKILKAWIGLNDQCGLKDSF